MEPITLNLMTQYHYLSDLQLSKRGSDLYFVETLTDLDHNDYQQRLHVLDTGSKAYRALSGWMRRCSYYVMNDGQVLFVKNDENNPTVHTRFFSLDPKDGSEKEQFTLPCAVKHLVDFDEDHYLVEATIQRRYANYHHLSAQERAAVEEEKRAEHDYLVFDEYPFYYNGEGIINGNRNTLFLINKKTLEIKDLVPPTVEVQTYDVDGGDIVYSGVDFTTVRWMTSRVWKVNAYTGETRALFTDENMIIMRVFYQDHKIMVLGTFGENYGVIEYGDFYELKNGKMHHVLYSDGSMNGSVGSDCRYGKMKSFVNTDGAAYFINTEESRANVLRFAGGKLTKAVDFEGSCDDMAIASDRIYVIALKGTKLPEVYEVKGETVTQLTSFNEPVLADHYVAVPEKLTLNKPVPIDGWVLKPMNYDSNKTYPAILDIHGGPVTVYGEVFYHEMQAWASMGYFVMFCNPRGSDGRGNAFSDFTNGIHGKNDFEDLMDFVDEVLVRYPAIDKERLGVTGGSYGGFMTNWIIGHTNRFKAAASQRSIANFISQTCSSDYGIDFPFEHRMEDVYNSHDALWDMSPLKYINNAVTPTLFIQSTEDYRCPFTEAIQMYTALRCRGVETKLVGFKGENHSLSRSGKPLHRLRRLHEITMWMENHLK